MKTWVIPDVHGCLLTLKYVVEEMIHLQKKDTLFILGDIVDRGPNSKGVIDYIMILEAKGYNVTTLRGNHEDFLLKAAEMEANPGLFARLGIRGGTIKDWFKHGGEDTLNSFGVSKANQIPEYYLKWIKSLPLYVSWGNYLIVHAGFNFKNDDIFADEEAMMWSRDYEIDVEKLGGKKIIHGHVPVDLEFLFSCLNSNRYQFIALDNGVYMLNRPGYGNLTALELNSLDLKIQPNLDMQ